MNLRRKKLVPGEAAWLGRLKVRLAHIKVFDVETCTVRNFMELHEEHEKKLGFKVSIWPAAPEFYIFGTPQEIESKTKEFVEQFTTENVIWFYRDRSHYSHHEALLAIAGYDTEIKLTRGEPLLKAEQRGSDSFAPKPVKRWFDLFLRKK